MKTLRQAAQEWLTAKVADGYESEGQAGRALLKHGCQSGMVGDLIYYSDTLQFYREHKGEINGILREPLLSAGISLPELFGEKWDSMDPLALERYNQNLLVWYAFEETVRQLIEDAPEYLK